MLVQIYFKEFAAMLEIVRVESVIALRDKVASSVNVTIRLALVTTVAHVAVSNLNGSFYIIFCGVSRNKTLSYVTCTVVTACVPPRARTRDRIG